LLVRRDERTIDAERRITMRVFLAGGTGVLGRATVPRLVAAGHQVSAVSRREESDRALRDAGAVPLRVDVFDAEAVATAAADAEAVVNLATHIPPTSRAALPKSWELNERLRRDASRAMAEAAIAAGARFVQESFAPTYADNGAEWIDEAHPLDPVAQTTTVVDAEHSADLVTQKGGTGVVLRFGLFYSADSDQTRQMLAAARKGRLLLPGPPERYISLIYVEDAAAAVVAALTVPAGIYNVVEDQPLTLAQHGEILAGQVGRDHVKPLPTATGRLKVMKVLSRSQRISNARLRAASTWQPAAPSGREGWAMVLAAVQRG
jgi:nucleoside-diphosphate-sugar epimerase